MCDLPFRQEREDIFRVHMAHIKVVGSKDDIVVRMAALTPGLRHVFIFVYHPLCAYSSLFSEFIILFVRSGAQIASICNEAALHAARFSKKDINITDFEFAVERVVSGMNR